MKRWKWALVIFGALGIVLVCVAAVVRSAPQFGRYEFARDAETIQDEEIVYDMKGVQTVYRQQVFHLRGNFDTIADRVEKELMAKGWTSSFKAPRGVISAFRAYHKTVSTGSKGAPAFAGCLATITSMPRLVSAKMVPTRSLNDQFVTVSITEGPVRTTWIEDMVAKVFPSKSKRRQTRIVGSYGSGGMIVYTVGGRSAAVAVSPPPAVPLRAAAPKKP